VEAGLRRGLTEATDAVRQRGGGRGRWTCG
jgi:hypothetical protein